MAELMMLPLNQLVLADYNPRKTFDPQSMAELTDSLRVQGMLQPVLVRQLTPAKGRKAATYEVVCGARRTKAARLADLQAIPCNVAELTDDQAFEAAITENLQREDVKPMEEALAFAAMVDKGYTLQQLGERFGKSHVHIWNRVQLAKATPEVQGAIERGDIPMTYARELVKFPAPMQVEAVEAAAWRYCATPAKYFTYLLERGNDLAHASFNIEKAGCASCEFNAAVRGISKEQICLNAEKFKQHQKEQVLDLLGASVDLIPVAFYYNIDKAISLWGDQLQRTILPLGHDKQYRVKPEPEVPELYEPDRDDFENDQEYGDACHQANMDFEQEMADYEAAIKLYQKETVDAPRGVFVYGAEMGTVVALARNEIASLGKEGLDQLQSSELQEVQEQMSKNREKLQRLPSLSAEKQYNAYIEQINELAIYKGIDTTDAQPDLLNEEMDALYLCLLSSYGWRLPINLRTLVYGADGSGYQMTDKQIQRALKVKQLIWPLLVRKHIQNAWQPQDGKGTNSQQRYAWQAIGKALADVDKAPVEAIQQKYEQQLAKVKEQQDGLKRLLRDLMGE